MYVGYDPKDEYTAAAVYAKDAGNYANQLQINALQGARIGILRDAFGSNDNSDSYQVNKVVNSAIESMRNAGAEIIDPITIPNLANYVEETAMYLIQSKHDFNNFLKQRMSSVDEIYNSKQYHEKLDLFKDIVAGPTEPENDPNFLCVIGQEGND